MLNKSGNCSQLGLRILKIASRIPFTEGRIENTVIRMPVAITNCGFEVYNGRRVSDTPAWASHSSAFRILQARIVDVNPNTVDAWNIMSA